MGDRETDEACRSFEDTLARFQRFVGIDPEVVVHELSRGHARGTEEVAVLRHATRSHRGLTPDTLAEIYECFPSASEIRISLGIFSVGFLIFTLMVKVATPICLASSAHGALGR